MTKSIALETSSEIGQPAIFTYRTEGDEVDARDLLAAAARSEEGRAAILQITATSNTILRVSLHDNKVTIYPKSGVGAEEFEMAIIAITYLVIQLVGWTNQQFELQERNKEAEDARIHDFVEDILKRRRA